MTPATTAKPTRKPTRAELAKARRRRVAAQGSTPAQRAMMRAANPLERMREKYRERIVAGCLLACFGCRRFVGHQGGCPGVAGAQSEAKGLPVCHEDARTGKLAFPWEPGPDGGMRMIDGQERHWRVVGRVGRAVITAARGG